MNQKGIANIILVVVVIVLAGTLGYFTLVKKTPSPTPTPIGAISPTPSSTLSQEQTSLLIHFSKGEGCGDTKAVVRYVPKTSGVARASLNELFAGPSASEKQQGYFSAFSEKSKNLLKNIKISNQIAYVDMNDFPPHPNATCSMAEFLAETGNTLKQFSTVKKVFYAINGDPTVFYEWSQIGCDSRLKGTLDDYCDPTPFK